PRYHASSRPPRPSTRHGGQSAPHASARLVTYAAPQNHLAAGHATRCAGWRAAGVGARVATQVDSSTRHGAPEIASHTAVDHQLASRHAAPDRLDPRAIPLHPDDARPLTPDAEELPERCRASTVHDL